MSAYFKPGAPGVVLGLWKGRRISEGPDIFVDLPALQVSRFGVVVQLRTYETCRRFRLTAAVLIAGAGGRQFTYRDLVEHCYGDERDGGPLTARNSIRVLLCTHVRPALCGIAVGFARCGQFFALLDLAADASRADPFAERRAA